MIVCPRCGLENEDSAMNCASCRINLQWALENPHEAVRDDLERVEGPPPEAQGGDRVARVETRPIRGFLIIVLLLAIPASGFLALWSWLNVALTPAYARSGHMTGAWLWLVVGVVCIPAAIVMLLRRQPRPNLLGGLVILALIGLTGGLLFGLLRLTLVILPEHTGRSLMIQYRLGERDFRGATLGTADLSEADLRGANLSGVDLGRANLSEAWLGKANLHQTDLSEANLSGANLGDADLSGANLSRAQLSGASLANANLHQTDLREANLSEANLVRAQLSGASLWKANLSQTDLVQADLSAASVKDADLSRANLSEANLSRVYLGGANLTGAIVTHGQLARAKSLEGTILPDGSVHD